MYNGNRKNNNYSAEFKIRVVIDKVKNDLDVKETVRKYKFSRINKFANLISYFIYI